MREAIFSIGQHGYALYFAWVLADQLGLPIPSIPALVAAGVLCGLGKMSFPVCVALGLLACAIGDAAWFILGRRTGGKIVRQLCRLSLEPDSCVRKTANIFDKHGAPSLLLAKFVPGIGTVAIPMAASSGMSVRAFSLYDLGGSALFVLTCLSAGLLLKNAVGVVETWSGHANALGFSLLASAVAALLGRRISLRRKLLRDLRIARISPADLLQMIKTDQKPFVVDLRHALDFLPNPQMIPTALRMDPAELMQRVHELPADRDIILYCTCPNEATAAAMALKLRQLGIARVRPLEGGFFGWRDRGFPLEEFYAPIENPQKGRHGISVGA